ncbi:MAG: hypothetical protein ACK5NT_13235 [Pyrinomonadaceae bacterium]
MKIAKIVSSNSHIDYVARVIDELDTASAPKVSDYGFGSFVSISSDEGEEAIGVVYNSIIVNPEYMNFGPRLSSAEELTVLSPDILNEQGILLGILLLGSKSAGMPIQRVPERVLFAGADVNTLNQTEFQEFHQNRNGGVSLHYYSQIISNIGNLGIPLLENIINRLATVSNETDSNQLQVLRQNLRWQQTIGLMRQ